MSWELKLLIPLMVRVTGETGQQVLCTHSRSSTWIWTSTSQFSDGLSLAGFVLRAICCLPMSLCNIRHQALPGAYNVCCTCDLCVCILHT